MCTVILISILYDGFQVSSLCSIVFKIILQTVPFFLNQPVNFIQRKFIRFIFAICRLFSVQNNTSLLAGPRPFQREPGRQVGHYQIEMHHFVLFQAER